MAMNDAPTTLPAAFTPDVLAALCAPFPMDVIEVRPGATNHDKSSALALPYADARVYEARLDAVVGVGNWSVDFQPWGEGRLIARLTILGVTQASTGEGDPNDPNAGTIAEAQSFKRACSRFTLGRYLYELPKLWGKGSVKGKHFAFDDGEAQRLIAEMYRRAALLSEHHAASTAPRTPAAPSAPTSNARLETARAALAEAEAKAATPPATSIRRPAQRLEFPPRADKAPAKAPAPSVGASPQQCGLIARLISTLIREDEAAASDIDALGTAQRIRRLPQVRSAQAVAELGLSKRDASALIDGLKALEERMQQAA